MRGNDYKLLVARYLVSAFADREIEVFDEVSIGTSMLGKMRRIDLLVLRRRDGRALSIECKYQDSSGTADEKIPYALQDLSALRIPGCICYAGSGFSEGVLHLLQSSPLAAYCLPDDTLRPIPRARESIHAGTWQLDHVIAQEFGFWDVILGDRAPLQFPPTQG
jgi:hypothetical protein